MIKVGKTYKTKGGKKVKIIRKGAFAPFIGSNNMDYNELGEASFVLMFQGRFRSQINDLIIK